jgi:hypothetical protein
MVMPMALYPLTKTTHGLRSQSQCSSALVNYYHVKHVKLTSKGQKQPMVCVLDSPLPVSVTCMTWYSCSDILEH